MSDILSHLKKLEVAATPGPWEFEKEPLFQTSEGYCVVEKTRGWSRQLFSDFYELSPDQKDAELMVAMRNALPLLLELVERVDELARYSTPKLFSALQDARVIETLNKLTALKGNV